MSNREQAEKNVEKYREVIIERLVSNGMMFVNEFPVYIPKCVANEMSKFIEHEFLDDGIYVSNLEFDTGNEFSGVFYTSELGMTVDEIRRKTIEHYS